VWNADVVAGRPYLVTELATNGTVDKYMAPRGIPPKEAVRWVRHAARGAARTHDAGLLHLDIKPGNLFLDAKGEALLGDFGLAAAMDANGHGPPVGTPATKAPEVEAGGPSSRASDVYSLGATLYALLTGVYPFPRPYLALRDLAPHIPQVLAQRIAKAMADDPADRHQKAGDLDAALGDLPDSDRYWFRTDEHVPGGHDACWRGQAAGKADTTVCVTAASGTRFDVTAQHQPSGRRITNACRTGVSRRELPRTVRAAIRASG
jgi:serine/threonine protein kinase